MNSEEHACANLLNKWNQVDQTNQKWQQCWPEQCRLRRGVPWLQSHRRWQGPGETRTGHWATAETGPEPEERHESSGETLASCAAQGWQEQETEQESEPEQEPELEQERQELENEC